MLACMHDKATSAGLLEEKVILHELDYSQPNPQELLPIPREKTPIRVLVNNNVGPHYPDTCGKLLKEALLEDRLQRK